MLEAPSGQGCGFVPQGSFFRAALAAWCLVFAMPLTVHAGEASEAGYVAGEQTATVSTEHAPAFLLAAALQLRSYPGGALTGGTAPPPVPQRSSQATGAAPAVPASPSPPPPSEGESGKKDGKIRLLGSVEFRGELKNMPKWQRVATAEAKSPTFDQDLGEYMRPALFKQWQTLVASTKSASVLDKAKAVTAFFNRWPYRTDREIWKVDDYWATPGEFLKRSGDCEDFSITKMYALIKLGVDPQALRIVALKDTIRNLAHAVLVVYADNEAYILDNLTDMVLPHTRYRNYYPHYSVNGIYRWAHVVPKSK